MIKIQVKCDEKKANGMAWGDVCSEIDLKIDFFILNIYNL